MTSKEELLKSFARDYDRTLFIKEVLNPMFDGHLESFKNPVKFNDSLTKSESGIIDTAVQYGRINMDDSSEVFCYEILLKKNVRIEQNKVTIQQYVRKLLISGQAALINFISPTYNDMWRMTLVSRRSDITSDGIKESTTHSKRYTFLVEKDKPNRTLAERIDAFSKKGVFNMESLVELFSVERMSKDFFNEYKNHYQNFVEYLTGKRLVKEKGKWVEKTTKEPDRFIRSLFESEKNARDFVKKLMGRIVFLYFVQKKRWLGASDTKYIDGDTDFIMNLFKSSGDSAEFWLYPLFFDALNKIRKDDNFKMPDGSVVKVPYLNGGLFEKEHGEPENILIPTNLFHNPDNADNPSERGFLDFLNAYNFTVYEDSQNDHTVAVDPEMLGHIFENLLEDNKEKGAFYTPKEIVHYMTQQSLIEYLLTHLSESYTVYKEIGNEQIELFGNEVKTGQLTMLEEIGDKALNRKDVETIVIDKDITNLTKDQLKKIDKLLSSVKICDPAIGSGAFPMGLLLEIHSIKELIAGELEIKWDAAKTKEDIIQNSIYGVDIEKGAVDIARLRFWLSLLVDEETPRPLPNLDYKIVEGDSLISKFDGTPVEIDWKKDSGSKYIDEIKKILKEIVKRQCEYFNAEATAKEGLKKKIDELKIELLINQLSHNREMFASRVESSGDLFGGKKTAKQLEDEFKITEFDEIIIKLKNYKKKMPKDFKHFDWKLDFPEILNPEIAGENCGFDIVIGNPPYGASYPDEYKKHFQTIFESAKTIKNVQKGSLDTFSLFIEQGYNLSKIKGNLNYIVPMSITSSEAMTGLHRILDNNCSIIRVSSYSNRPKQIFNNAGLRTSILFFIKTNNANEHLYTTRLVRRRNSDELNTLISNLEFVDSKSVKLYGRYPKIGNDIELKILTKMFQNGKPLMNYHSSDGKAIYYRTSGGRYFNVITNYPSGSTQEKPVFLSDNIANFAGSVLSSDLFYFYQQVYSDGLHIKSFEIDNFPIPEINKDLIIPIVKAYSVYLKDIEKNVIIHSTTSYSNISEFKEYKINKSKHLIDKLDDLICPLYGLTAEETDYIKNYEIEYRLSDEVEDD